MAVVAGRSDAPGAPLNVPPTFASTYRDGESGLYGRWDNPTWRAFETALGALEGGRAVAFSCGQAAATAMLSTVPDGGTVVHPVDSYLGTRGLLRALADSGRLQARAVDVTDTAQAVHAVSGADLVWLESPTNPSLGIADLPEVIAAARRAGARAVVDNTFATPLCQQPLSWGAAAVVHSATKYIGGHSDLLLGVVVTGDEQLHETLLAHRSSQGAIPGTMEAFLALRGLRTLPVRFARQQETAGGLAVRLSGHRAVSAVRYPGLPTDPFHARARAQMSGFGAMVSFEVATAAHADRLVSALELVVPTTSLGGVESSIERRGRWPGEAHVAPGLLRMSVGLEHVDDVWADLAHALGVMTSG